MRLARPTILVLLMAASATAQEPLLLGQPRADYAARRRDLMERIVQAEARRGGFGRPTGEIVVVLRGGDDRAKEDFEAGRFRQENCFAYLTGFEHPGAWFVMLPRQKRATLYLPPKGGPSVMNGEDPRPGPGTESATSLGFQSVAPTSRLLADVFSALADPIREPAGDTPRAVVYTIPPNPDRADDRPAAAFTRLLREAAPNTTYRDLAPVVAEMRKVKTPAEMDLIRKAIAVTGDANEAVIRSLRPGRFEYELEGKILGAFLEGGASRPGFSSIVGSGPNATIPHYFRNDRRMADGDLVVVDIGAEYRLYTADVTRTYPVNGRFTPRQREIYQLVLDAQRAAEAHVQPGVTRLDEMTGFVRAFLRKNPLRARDTDGREHAMDHFFIHGLSHYLGMDVHDVGDTSTPMKPGEVFTIEPGIYIPSENIGVRIEDDYLISETGLVKLSKDIASDPGEIEKKMEKAGGK